MPEATALVWLADGESEAARHTYSDLHGRAKALAACVSAACVAGDRVLLALESAADFAPAFVGCMYAGVIAVPVYPPRGRHGLERLGLIASDAKAVALIGTAKVLATLHAGSAEVPRALRALCLVDVVDALNTPATGREPAGADPDSVAFLQYTSGSTGQPRGVAISHRNLIANQRAIFRSFLHSPESVVVGWLPLFHDMGLIGNLLQPLFGGFPAILMPPAAAVQKPMRVVRAVARYGATSCGGPNFFYELCVRKFARQELERAGMPDLSRWARAFNGSEPVRAETIDRFSQLFERYGFRRSAFYPCYGLAEATLFVSGGQGISEPRIIALQGDALERDEAVRASAPGPEVSVVSCGRSAPDHCIRIVDPATAQPRSDGMVGEVWVGGPSVACGYWADVPGTHQTFGGRIGTDPTRYLRTGDLGFLDQGELFVTGRLKDLIIVHGRNHYPQDIERTIEASHPALKRGCGAVFAMTTGSVERLCAVHEVERSALRRLIPAEVRQAAREAVALRHNLRLADLVLVPPGGVPKTSSGKIRRRECRSVYAEGKLSSIGDQPGRRQSAAAEA